MLVFPNAKINIGLFITEKRLDGYHNLETVFYPITLCDALEIFPSSASSLSVYPQGWAGAVKDNLVWKAWALLQQAHPEKVAPVAMHLIKQIPTGAGLGGGSADAAFALRALDSMFDLQLSQWQLQQYALALGSDCPFFINNLPAFAHGRGELLEPLQVQLSNYWVVLLCPQLPIATREAFSKVAPRNAPFDLRQIASLEVEAWKHFVCNDFEESVFAHYPALATVKAVLYECGASYASMSGSGSAFYGLFAKPQATTLSSQDLYQEALRKRLSQTLQDYCLAHLRTQIFWG